MLRASKENLDEGELADSSEACKAILQYTFLVPVGKIH